MICGMPGGRQFAVALSCSPPFSCASLYALTFAAYSGVNAGCSGGPLPPGERVSSHTPDQSGSLPMATHVSGFGAGVPVALLNADAVSNAAPASTVANDREASERFELKIESPLWTG